MILSSSWEKTVLPPGTFHPAFHSFLLASLTAVDDSSPERGDEVAEGGSTKKDSHSYLEIGCLYPEMRGLKSWMLY